MKIIKILLLIFYISILLFYSGLVVPKYLTCINCVYEGEMGVDIWGNEVQCFGENKEIGKAFFQILSLFIAGFTIVLACLFLHYNNKKIKKQSHFSIIIKCIYIAIL